MLTFDDPTHTYRWNGVVVPSVTQALNALHPFGSFVTPEMLEAARLRGTNVHLMCQFYDEDRLDRSEFVESELAYLPAWERFLRDVQPNWNAVECRFFNPDYSYAGTPDREGVLEAFHPTDEWIIDIKTSAEKHPVWGPQTAAYERGRRIGNKVKRRASVRLRPDGTFAFDEWRSPKDWAVFLSALTIHQFMKEHRL